MNPTLTATLAAAFLLSGIVLAAAGIRPAPIKPAAPTPLRVSRRRLSRATLTRAGIGVAAGVVAAVLTGWVVLILIIPAAAAGIPYLFDDGHNKSGIAKLDALDEWTRSLAGILGAGTGLTEGLAATMKSAGAPIRPEVGRLVARMKSRVPAQQALRMFANELNDTTSDKIVQVLMLSATRSVGVASMLDNLAESVSEDVAARRMVMAERAKQDSVMRIVTLITLVVFGGFLMFGGSFVAPYGTAIGQPLLVLLISGYVAVLVWAKRMNRNKPLPRLLGEAAK